MSNPTQLHVIHSLAELPPHFYVRLWLVPRPNETPSSSAFVHYSFYNLDQIERAMLQAKVKGQHRVLPTSLPLVGHIVAFESKDEAMAFAEALTGKAPLACERDMFCRAEDVAGHFKAPDFKVRSARLDAPRPVDVRPPASTEDPTMIRISISLFRRQIVCDSSKTVDTPLCVCDDKLISTSVPPADHVRNVMTDFLRSEAGKDIPGSELKALYSYHTSGTSSSVGGLL